MLTATPSESGSAFPGRPSVEGRADIEVVQVISHWEAVRRRRLARWNWLASRPMFWMAGMFWKAEGLPEQTIENPRRSRTIWGVLRRGR